VEAMIKIANSDEICLLSSIGFQPKMKEPENDGINSIYQCESRSLSLHHFAWDGLTY
jgi:hypothetical protein